MRLAIRVPLEFFRHLYGLPYMCASIVSLLRTDGIHVDDTRRGLRELVNVRLLAGSRFVHVTRVGFADRFDDDNDDNDDDSRWGMIAASLTMPRNYDAMRQIAPNCESRSRFARPRFLPPLPPAPIRRANCLCSY